MSSLFDRVVDRMSPPPPSDTSADPSATMQMAVEFADIARRIHSGDTLDQALQRIVELAVQTIDGVEHAAVTVVRRGQFTTAAATSELPKAVDALQIELDEGPCVDSMKNHESYRTGDLAHETRWPKFGPRAAAETGVRSMLSFRLFTDEHTLGALNLFSTKVHAFTDEAAQVAAIFAVHAALAMDSARTSEQVEQMQRALDSNREISMAMGIIIAHRHCTEDEAFGLLREASQHLNRKLRDVATEVLYSGQLPDPRRA